MPVMVPASQDKVNTKKRRAVIDRSPFFDLIAICYAIVAKWAAMASKSSFAM